MRTTLAILLSGGAWLLAAGCAHHTAVSTAGPPRPSAPQSVPQMVEPPAPPAAPATGRVVAAEAIYFNRDEALVEGDARPILDEIAQRLRANPQARLRIEGNCDERGTTEYNLVLGEHRARSAREYLIRMGIPDDRIQIVSYGSERPRQTGHDESAWAQNRRDDLRVR
jgi:peptidoglycan-associated lipoprotein